MDESSNILLANRAVESIFGYPSAELKGQSVSMLMPEHCRMRYEHTVAGYLENGKGSANHSALEVLGRHKAGHEIPLELTFGEFALKGQRFFTGFMRKKQVAVGS